MRKLFWIVPFIFILVFLPQITPSFILKGFFNRIFSTKFHADTSIQTIHLSWLGPQEFQNITLSNPNMSGYISKLELSGPLWNLNAPGKDFRVQEGSLTLATQADFGLDHINAAMKNHTLSAQGDALPKGHFTLNGKVFSAKDLDITFDLQEIPTLAIDQLLNGKNTLSQILGAVINTTGSWVFNENTGQLKLDLRSSNVATNLNAKIDRDFITLQEPLVAALAITPELSATLLRNANPLFLTGITTKNPVQFRIEPEGFRYPWNDFDLKKLAIPKASLNMGQLECRTGETLSKLISLFKNFQRSDTSLVWVTPIRFSIQEGIVQTARMDALISNAIHICTWGKIDLIRDQLDMTLGICADTLKSSFGIESLPSNYVLKIPLQGTTQNPELDTKSATIKIAALAAVNQLPNIGGKVGKMFGGTLNAAKATMENQEDVPAPQRPFPWE